MTKKYWKYIVLVLIILFAIGWIAIREGLIKRQTKQIDDLHYNNLSLQVERNNLSNNLKVLQNEYEKLFWRNDSLKNSLNEKRKELKELQERDKKIIDSLKNIPADTVFMRLQALYPPGVDRDYRFPFSASQIKPIYSTAISFGLLTQEYSLQGKTLNNCLDLNKGYESGITNLNLQIGNLQDNIKKADRQIGNYQKEISILGKKIKRKSFWNYTLMGLSGLVAGYAILK